VTGGLPPGDRGGGFFNAWPLPLLDNHRHAISATFYAKTVARKRAAASATTEV